MRTKRSFRRRRAPKLLAAVSVTLAASCSLVLPVFGYPPEALRKTAPDGIEKGALTVGATAQPVDLENATGAKWSLAKADPKKSVVLVFYRGHW